MKFTHTFNDIVSIENLLAAWQEFVKGKRQRIDVQEFHLRLMSNILVLHSDLRNKTYKHRPYQHFRIFEPKERNIHKATVRDRLLHRALHRVLYQVFDQVFIYDSHSCRVGKGTHRAINRFRDLETRASFSHTKTCFVLKCDIRKFFANIDHGILLEILTRHIPDTDILWLLGEIIGSFNSGTADKGLPLGNLTSQLFANIYMNEFDQFVKHKLKMKYYIRYADDFVILSQAKTELDDLILIIQEFLTISLKLSLHLDKVFIKTIASGVDFLGWIHFPDYRVLRRATRRRMMQEVNEKNLSSYMGLCKHGNTFALRGEILRKTEALTTRF